MTIIKLGKGDCVALRDFLEQLFVFAFHIDVQKYAKMSLVVPKEIDGLYYDLVN
jgi:hypothetical protein